MTKKIALLILAVTVIVLALIFYGYYSVKYSPDATQARKNVENLGKITYGMDTTDVVKIMGKPNDKYWNMKTLTWTYNLKSGESGYIIIEFDSTYRLYRKEVLFH